MSNRDDRILQHNLLKLWSITAGKWVGAGGGSLTDSDHLAGSFTLPQVNAIINDRISKGEQIRIMLITEERPA